MWRKKIPILHFFFWTNMGRHILEKFLQYSEIQSAIWFANSCSLCVETLLRCKKVRAIWIPSDRYLTKNHLFCQQHSFHQDQKRKSLISLPSARRLEYVTEFYWGKIYLLQTFWTVWKNLDEIAQTLYINYWSPGQVPNCAKIMSITTDQISVEEEIRTRE